MSERSWNALVSGGDFFEAPRWHDGAWWVSDFYRQRVSEFAPTGRELSALVLDDRPSGLGWLPDGSMVISSMSRRRLLRVPPNGQVEILADLSNESGGDVNDLVVDRFGHVFVGDFGYDIMAGDLPAPTTLKRVSPDGTVSIAADDLYFPNGVVISADGRTLIVCETLANRCTAFDLSPNGGLQNRREWATFGPLPQGETADEYWNGIVRAPDGCTLDAENHLWCADSLSGEVLRIAPDGSIVEILEAPDGLNAFACALGGPTGTSILVCAAPDYFADRRAGAGEAVLFTIDVDVAHAGLP